VVLCFWIFQWNWNQRVLWFWNIFNKKEINDSLEIQRTTPTRIQSVFFVFFFYRIASPRVDIPGIYPLVLSSEKWVGTCANVELIWVLYWGAIMVFWFVGGWNLLTLYPVLRLNGSFGSQFPTNKWAWDKLPNSLRNYEVYGTSQSFFFSSFSPSHTSDVAELAIIHNTV